MVAEIDPDELHAQLDRGEDVQIIDIRHERSFADGHIRGAENIPFDRFAREIENHEWGDEIVVACPMGESSVQAARLLESYEGVDDAATVANLRGGYQAWEYELETDTESPEED